MFAFLFGQALVGSSVLFRVSGEQLFESSRCRRWSARLFGLVFFLFLCFGFLFGQALVGSSVLFRVSGEQLFESSRCRRRSARLPGSDLNQNSRTGISPKRVMTDRKITRVTDDSAPGNMPDWPAAAIPVPTAAWFRF